MVDNRPHSGEQSAAEIVIAGTLDVTPDGVQEPERTVDRVVLGVSGVGSVGEHPFGHRLARGEQQLASFICATGLKKQPFVGRHGVAGPVAEPRISGDDGRLRRTHDELVGGMGERLVDPVRSRRLPADRGEPSPRAFNQIAGRHGCYAYIADADVSCPRLDFHRLPLG